MLPFAGVLLLIILFCYLVVRPVMGVVSYFCMLQMATLVYLVMGSTPDFYSRGLAMILLVLGLVIALFRYGQFKPFWYHTDWLWLLLTLYIAASLLWTPALTYGKDKLLYWIMVASILYFAPRFFTANIQHINSLLTALALLSGLLSIVALFFEHMGLMRYTASRLETFGDPLGAARYAWMALLMAIYLILRGPTWKRVMGVIIAPATVWFALLTGSRGAIVSAAMAVVVFFLLLRGTSRLWLIFAGVVVVPIFLFVFSAIVPSAPVERIMTIFTGSFDESGRPALWRAAWAQGWATMALGGGSGSFPTCVGMPDIREYAHNLFLEAWGEFGIVGFSLITAITAIPAWLLYRVRQQTRHIKDFSLALAAIGSLTFFGLAQAQTTSDMPGQTGLWLGLGLILCLERERKAYVLQQAQEQWDLEQQALYAEQSLQPS